MRLIDADAVLKWFAEYWAMQKKLGRPSKQQRAIYITMRSMVNSVKTVDAVPVRHGKWIYGENERGYDGYYCSKCCGHVRWYGKASEQSINFIEKYNYCPNCGAKMDGAERKDDDSD